MQREALSACGITDVREIASESEIQAPCVVLTDDLFITRWMLRAFLAVPGNVRLALAKEGRVVQDTLPAQELDEVEGGVGYPLWKLESGAIGGARPVLVDANEDVRTMNDVPRVFKRDGTLTFALSARIAMRVQHWVHVLRANHLALLAIAAEFRERPKWRNFAGLAWLLLRSFPPNEARVMRRLVRRGRRVKIHPSAVVEASILGDGVQIGANAVVRASWLGPGARVADGGLVEMSVLGAGAVVTRQSNCNFMVMYPGSVLGHGIHQISLLGRDAFVSAKAAMYDFKPDGNVKIEHRGKFLDSGSNFLGACIGHGTFLGAGVWVQHGRAIPNGVMLIKDPAETVKRVAAAAEPGMTLVVRDGVAVPLESLASRKPS